MLLTDELCVKVSHLSTANVSQSHIMKAGGKYLIIGVTRSEKYSPVCTFPFVLAQHGHHYMKGVMDEFGIWRGKDRFLDTLITKASSVRM